MSSCEHFMSTKFGKKRKVHYLCTGLLGFLCLFLGALIYLLWRQKELLGFQLLDACGLGPCIDAIRSRATTLLDPTEYMDNPYVDFLLYSLPDGLWTLGYMLCIHTWISISEFRSLTQRLCLISICPLLGIGTELLQAVGWLNGTFDWGDLLAYGVPFIIYLSRTSWNIINQKRSNHLWAI